MQWIWFSVDVKCKFSFFGRKMMLRINIIIIDDDWESSFFSGLIIETPIFNSCLAYTCLLNRFVIFLFCFVSPHPSFISYGLSIHKYNWGSKHFRIDAVICGWILYFGIIIKQTLIKYKSTRSMANHPFVVLIYFVLSLFLFFVVICQPKSKTNDDDDGYS